MNKTFSLQSVTRWYDPFLTAIGPIALYLLLYDAAIATNDFAVLLILASMAPVCVAEFLRQRRHYPLRPKRPLTEVGLDTVRKMLGTILGIGLIMTVWWLFPIYDKPFYQPLSDLIPRTLPWLLSVTLVVIFYSEWRLGPAQDQTWQLSLAALGRWKEIDIPLLKTALIGLLVRAIFLPMNVCALVSSINYLRKQPLDFTGMVWPQIHAFLTSMNWALLIVAIIPGYLFSLRLLGTSIRRADASWFGWAVTLACYPPLLDGVFNLWFNYNPTSSAVPYMKPWARVTDEFMPLMLVTSFAILLMEYIHWWGEAIMGLRASNLTHRGVISNGPFRLTRHPIYVSKCIGWLLISMPFLMGSTFLECVRLTILWGGVCLIYYGRAWAEERLFADDPDYIAYARWVDRHGVFAWAGKYCPPLTFEWKLKRWQANGAISRETVP